MNKKRLWLLQEELPLLYPKFKYYFVPPVDNANEDPYLGFFWTIGYKVTVLITFRNGRKRIIQFGNYWTVDPDAIKKEKFNNLRQKFLKGRDDTLFALGRKYISYRLLDPDDKEDNEIMNKYLKKKSK